MEEFDEADILWPDRGGVEQDEHFGSATERRHAGRGARRREASNPVKIPSRPPPQSVHPCTANCNFSCTDDDGGGDCCRTPPHIIVAQRVADKTAAFSVCAGTGGGGSRLKGRELSHVRNSILRMTGFLET